MLKKLVFANIDYKDHLTDEGWQLQEGLRHAGWVLSGQGYDDGCRDVPTLLNRHKPDIVFIQDMRDWTPNITAFRDDLYFTNMKALATAPCKVVTVCKDAATFVDEQRRFSNIVRPDAYVVYYSPKSVLRHSSWLSKHTLIRIHHSVDAQLCQTIFKNSSDRKFVCVTGDATRSVYPLRHFIMSHARHLGIDVKPHPGFGNRGSDTPNYLSYISSYRLHFSTASRFDFALRKIIESLCVGTLPITDLSKEDVLPEIDEFLWRIPKIAEHAYTPAFLMEIVREALNFYKTIDVGCVVQKACRYYDWKAAGRRLDQELCSLCT